MGGRRTQAALPPGSVSRHTGKLPGRRAAAAELGPGPSVAFRG